MADFEFDLEEFLRSVEDTLEALSDGTINDGDLSTMIYLQDKVVDFVEATAEERLGKQLQREGVADALGVAALVLRLALDKIYN